MSSSSSSPRVVSAAPSATATLSAMGASDQIVGVTAHCHLKRPVIGGWLNPDYEVLADLEPDLVLTTDSLQAEVRDALRDRGYTVCHVSPQTLPEVIDSFETLGRAIECGPSGRKLAERAQTHIRRIRDLTHDLPTRTVYCEEWGDPPMAAGNWVPEAVSAAGGTHPFCAPGDRSREVSADEVESVRPTHVVLHHCGHGVHVSENAFTGRGWRVDPTIHVLNDDQLNQRSPALIDGIQTLAEWFHDVSVPERTLVTSTS